MENIEAKGKKNMERFHAMDNLRATAMIAGIILHAGMAYLTIPFKWIVNDSHKNVFFDLMGLLIHSFRMPLFFLIAGFFAHFLYQRTKQKEFIQHKVKRILIPFVLFWIIAIPCLYFMSFLGDYVTSIRFKGLNEVWFAFVHFMLSGKFMQENQLMYLWFLFYLILFYIFQILIEKLREKFTKEGKDIRIEKIGTFLIQSPWKAFLFAIPTTAALFLMDFWTIDTPMILIPELKFIAFYGLFFLFGYTLYQYKTFLYFQKNKAWLNLLLGVLMVLPIHLFLFLNYGMNPKTQTPFIQFCALFTLALATWMIVLGIMGLFLRYLDKPYKILRYISDASYWMYLAHLPLICFLQIVFVNLDIPSILKFFLVCFFGFGILLFTYETMVRYTFIGTLLNGKKERISSFKDKIWLWSPIKKNKQ